MKWSLESYVYHNEAMRKAERRFQTERDKRYTERFKGQEQALKIALASIKERVEKSDQAYSLRFDQVNEWRRTYSDLVTGTMSRNEIEERFKSLNAKIDTKLDPITNFVSGQQGSQGSRTAQRSSIIAMFGILGTIAGIIGTIVAVVIVLTKG